MLKYYFCAFIVRNHDASASNNAEGAGIVSSKQFYILHHFNLQLYIMYIDDYTPATSTPEYEPHTSTDDISLSVSTIVTPELFQGDISEQQDALEHLQPPHTEHLQQGTPPQDQQNTEHLQQGMPPQDQQNTEHLRQQGTSPQDMQHIQQGTPPQQLRIQQSENGVHNDIPPVTVRTRSKTSASAQDKSALSLHEPSPTYLSNSCK